jgi:hypothetical protein
MSNLYRHLLDLDDFPERAWKKLDPQVRAAISRNLSDTRVIASAQDPALQIQVVGNWRAFTISDLMEDWADFESSHQPTIRTGVFYLNTNYDKNVIIREFKDWLERQMPTRETRGRKTHLDPLHQLGALRLQFHCETLTQAQEMIRPLRSRGRGMQYQSWKAWDRACNKARVRFITLLSLPQNELAIQDNGGWRGNRRNG